ncbi:MAG TPA: hypothetical protein PLA39_05695, partial [Methanoculleus sp.]|nr:hypothetical protein [Methanoculleus sp.]
AHDAHPAIKEALLAMEREGTVCRSEMREINR